jgi:ABC-type multidrug transport system ATPase subunit
MATLKVHALSKRYGSKLVIQKLSFEADSGIYGIAGPNGSGKTTLMRCLSGLMRPSSGSVEWIIDGKPADRFMMRSMIGLAGPWLQLYREMSCFENLSFVGQLHSLTDLNTRIDHCLDRVGLATMKHHGYGELSSGQQQRLKIASAILHEPKVLLLDEPGTNLDQAGFDMVRTLLEESRQQGRLVILASNEAQELDLCDHIISVQATA